jgi:hypothetical protein
MKKVLRRMIFSGLLLIFATTGCNLSVSQPTTMPPLPTASATQMTASLPTATSTETLPVASPTSEFAPFCESISATASPLSQCQVPYVEESSTFCSDKAPYNLILMDKGLTYEVLTDGFTCSGAGVKNDKQMITCTGQMAANFAINVCSPSCVIPTVQATITQCPQGYNYNDLQGCCTQEPKQLNPNCTAFKFKTTTCVVDCFQFKKEAKCKSNSYACQWNVEDEVCELRK